MSALEPQHHKDCHANAGHEYHPCNCGLDALRAERGQLREALEVARTDWRKGAYLKRSTRTLMDAALSSVKP